MPHVFDCSKPKCTAALNADKIQTALLTSFYYIKSQKQRLCQERVETIYNTDVITVGPVPDHCATPPPPLHSHHRKSQWKTSPPPKACGPVV